jgi:hypothetical protein
MSTTSTPVCSIFGTPEVIGWLEENCAGQDGPHKSAFGISAYPCRNCIFGLTFNSSRTVDGCSGVAHSTWSAAP